MDTSSLKVFKDSIRLDNIITDKKNIHPPISEILLKRFFRANNQLGNLTVLHLTHADLYGVSNNKTLQLAYLCGLAVDAPKSGVFIKTPKTRAIEFWVFSTINLILSINGII